MRDISFQNFIYAKRHFQQQNREIRIFKLLLFNLTILCISNNCIANKNTQG